LQAHLAVALHGIGRHGDDARRLPDRSALADTPRRLQPIHLGHLYVQSNSAEARMSLTRLAAKSWVCNSPAPVQHVARPLACGHRSPRNFSRAAAPGRWPVKRFQDAPINASQTTRVLLWF
jgi:hypothetical protein